MNSVRLISPSFTSAHISFLSSLTESHSFHYIPHITPPYSSTLISKQPYTLLHPTIFLSIYHISLSNLWTTYISSHNPLFQHHTQILIITIIFTALSFLIILLIILSCELCSPHSSTTLHPPFFHNSLFPFTFLLYTLNTLSHQSFLHPNLLITTYHFSL